MHVLMNEIGTLLGVYATNNGKGGTTPGYFSNWRYMPVAQLRE